MVAFKRRSSADPSTIFVTAVVSLLLFLTRTPTWHPTLRQTTTTIFADAFSTSFSPFIRSTSKRQRNMSALGSTTESVMETKTARKPETKTRVQQVRDRCKAASLDAANAIGCASQTSDGTEWWRTPPTERSVTLNDPIRVLVAGGGVAGLVVAAACHSKQMKVAIFEQASSYAPYGGPIQIQSNALRALEKINPRVYQEIREAGTVTADRVSGLKIGYKKGVFLGLGKLYNKGDWLVQFDTLIPALQAGLPPTVVVDRPVIQQILLNHGLPEGTVRIKSRIANYEELGQGKGIKVHFSLCYFFFTFL